MDIITDDLHVLSKPKYSISSIKVKLKDAGFSQNNEVRHYFVGCSIPVCCW